MIKRILTSWNENQEYGPAAKIVIAIIFSAVVALAAVFALIIFWKVAPYDDVRFEGAPVVDTKKTYYPGDFVEVITPYFCNDGVPTQIERKIGTSIGNLGLLPIEFYAPPQPVCIEDGVAAVQIPTETPPGEWQIVIDTTFEPNPVRAITIERKTEFFTVAPLPKPKS